jgi:hypothetical protein
MFMHPLFSRNIIVNKENKIMLCSPYRGELPIKPPPSKYPASYPYIGIMGVENVTICTYLFMLAIVE